MGKSGASQIVMMEQLSLTYGWTPSQIRAENFHDIDDYFEIIKIRGIIEKYEAKKAKQRKR